LKNPQVKKRQERPKENFSAANECQSDKFLQAFVETRGIVK
jgi:hypothetical protein